MRAFGESDVVHSIDWHDSPKLFQTRGSKFSSSAKPLRSVSDQKFNEEFDRWFSKNDSDEQLSCSRNSDNEDTESTPPLLRVPLNVLRKKELQRSDENSTDVLDIENHDIDDFALARSLEESKKRMRKVMEKRKSLALSFDVECPFTSSQSVCEEGAKDITEPVCKIGDTGSSEVLSSTLLGTPDFRRTKRFKLCESVEPSPIIPSTSYEFKKGEESNYESSAEDELSTPRNAYLVSDVFDKIEETNTSTDVLLPRSLYKHGDEDSTKHGTRIAVIEMNSENFLSKAGTSAATAKDNQCFALYDSMDDEEINEFLSQLPESFSKPKTVADVDPSFMMDDKEPTRNSTAFSVRNINVHVKKQKDIHKKSCLIRARTQRTIIRRCKTLDSDITFARHGKDLANDERVEVENNDYEARPRSASLSGVDSFWDDAEFAEADFSAIDAIT